MNNFSKCIATISIVLLLLTGTLMGCGCSDKTYVTKVFPQGPGANDAWESGDYIEKGRNQLRYATFLVASSEAGTETRNGADFVCSGSQDQVQINEAIDEVTSIGGNIDFTEGTFYIGAAINLTDRSAGEMIDFAGAGMFKTIFRLRYNGAIFDTGTKAFQGRFSDMKLDGYYASGTSTRGFHGQFVQSRWDRVNTMDFRTDHYLFTAAAGLTGDSDSSFSNCMSLAQSATAVHIIRWNEPCGNGWQFNDTILGGQSALSGVVARLTFNGGVIGNVQDEHDAGAVLYGITMESGSSLWKFNQVQFDVWGPNIFYVLNPTSAVSDLSIANSTFSHNATGTNNAIAYATYPTVHINLSTGHTFNGLHFTDNVISGLQETRDSMIKIVNNGTGSISDIVVTGNTVQIDGSESYWTNGFINSNDTDGFYCTENNESYITVNSGSATGLSVGNKITHGLSSGTPSITDITLTIVDSGTGSASWTPIVSSGTNPTSTNFWVWAPIGKKFIWRVDTED